MGCELSGAKPPTNRLGLAFGRRAWEIRVTAPQRLPLEESHTWPFAWVGLLATGLLSALHPMSKPVDLLLLGWLDDLPEIANALTTSAPPPD